jgi:hypothetical protein
VPAVPALATRRRGVRAVATAVAVVAGVWAVGALLGPGTDAAAPGAPGSVTTAPSSALVLPLTQVVEADGARDPLPDDLVGWLQRHPQVTVLGVRRMRGGGWGSGGVDTWHGVRAVSVEYERSAPTATTPALQRVVGLPLLCDTATCTRLVGGVRVRTTFVSAPGTVVAVETRWTPAPGDPVGLLPEPRRTQHREAVLDVVRRLAAQEP